jgi:predicted nucleic acid-binding protein
LTQLYFLDSSAVLKRYVRESGSGWITNLLETSGATFYVARIASVEVVSALARSALSKKLSRGRSQDLIHQFRVDLTSKYRFILFNDSVVERAMIVAETHWLRAYDSVQLASALTLASRVKSALIFVSADVQLNNVALAEGLAVENPNDHS